MNFSEIIGLIESAAYSINRGIKKKNLIVIIELQNKAKGYFFSRPVKCHRGEWGVKRYFFFLSRDPLPLPARDDVTMKIQPSLVGTPEKSASGINWSTEMFEQIFPERGLERRAKKCERAGEKPRTIGRFCSYNAFPVPVVDGWSNERWNPFRAANVRANLVSKQADDRVVGRDYILTRRANFSSDLSFARTEASLLLSCVDPEKSISLARRYPLLRFILFLLRIKLRENAAEATAEYRKSRYCKSRVSKVRNYHRNWNN